MNHDPLFFSRDNSREQCKRNESLPSETSSEGECSRDSTRGNGSRQASILLYGSIYPAIFRMKGKDEVVDKRRTVAKVATLFRKQRCALHRGPESEARGLEAHAHTEESNGFRARSNQTVDLASEALVSCLVQVRRSIVLEARRSEVRDPCLLRRRRRFRRWSSQSRDGVRVERFLERRRRGRRGRLDRQPRRLSMLALQLHLRRERSTRRAPVSQPRRATLLDGSLNRRFRRLTSRATGRHRSLDTHDIDLKRIFTEICDDFYDRMKLVNYVRSEAAQGKAIRTEQLLSKVSVPFGSHRFDV